MSFTYSGHRGHNAVKLQGTSLSVTVNADIPAGTLVIARCALDPSTHTDGAGSNHSVSDSQGNTYTRLAEYIRGTGSFNTGVEVSLHYSVLTTGLAGDVDTVTFTHVNQLSRALALETFTFSGTLQVASAAGAAGDGTAPEVTLSALDSAAYLFLGEVGLEYNSSAWSTQDADFDDYGTPVVGVDSGANPLADVALGGGYRLATAMGSTYAPALGTSVRWAAVLVALTASGGTTPQTVNAQAGALHTAPAPASPTPGGVVCGAAAVTLAAGGGGGEVVPGSVTVPAQSTVLVLPSPTASVLPGGVMVTPEPATGTVAGLPGQVTTGGATQAALGTLALAGWPGDLLPGVVTVTAAGAALGLVSFPGQPRSGARVVAGEAVLVTVSLQATLTPGAAGVLAADGELKAQAQAAHVLAGGGVLAGTGTLGLTAVPAAVSAGHVQVTAGVVALTTVALTATLAPRVALAAEVAVLTTVALTATLGGVTTIAGQPGALAVASGTATALPGTVTLLGHPLTLALQGAPGTVAAYRAVQGAAGALALDSLPAQVAGGATTVMARSGGLHADLPLAEVVNRKYDVAVIYVTEAAASAVQGADRAVLTAAATSAPAASLQLATQVVRSATLAERMVCDVETEDT